MKVLLASFEPRRDRDPDRLTLRSKANPHRERQAVTEPTGQAHTTLRAHPPRCRMPLLALLLMAPTLIAVVTIAVIVAAWLLWRFSRRPTASGAHVATRP